MKRIKKLKKKIKNKQKIQKIKIKVYICNKMKQFSLELKH